MGMHFFAYVEGEPKKILSETLNDIWRDSVAHLPNIIAAIGILFLVWVAVWIFKKFVPRLLEKGKWRSSMKELVMTLGKAAIWLIGFVVAAMVLFPGLTPSKALGAAGLASVAVGLAFKDIFQNFFAGVLLMWKFPFEPGDFIECGDVKGKVLETELRLTTIRETNGELVIVPNAYLVGNPVNVLTQKPLRRLEVATGVAYGEDVAKAVEVIEEAVASCRLLDESKDRKVLVSNFGASSIDIDILAWAKSTPMGQREARNEVITSVKAALDQAGIEIPFPYRTMTFAEPLRIESESPEKAVG